MVFSVALSPAQRSTLADLRNIEKNQGVTQRRLSSGREVNSVTDDVFRYFSARALEQRAQSLIEHKASIEQTISTLKNTISTIDQIIALFKQIKGVLLSSVEKDQSTLARLGSTIPETLQEIGQITLDSHYQGINLLIGNAQSATIDNALSVQFSDKHRLDIPSYDIFRVDGGLAGGTVLHDTIYTYRNRFISYNQSLDEVIVHPARFVRHGQNFNYTTLASTSGRASIMHNVVNNIDQIVRNLNTHSQMLGSYLGIVKNRVDVNTHLSTEHRKGVDKYTLADINQEGAFMIALRTRYSLSLNALALSGIQQENVLFLFD